MELLIQMVIQMNETNLQFNEKIIGWNAWDNEVIINVVRVII